MAEDLSESLEYFLETLRRDEDKSPAVAAIETLYRSIETSKATTVVGLTTELRHAVEAMRDTDYSTTSIASATELFMRFISLCALDKQDDFAQCMNLLLERGKVFLNRVKESRSRIANYCVRFIGNDNRILTHSYSRVVCQALIKASKAGAQFHVFVTQSLPDYSGAKMKKKMEEANIPCTLILDSAVGYLMENIDFVVLGAEGVMETGGIINKIGSLGVSVCAKAFNKPVYVMVESIKFVKEYPLSQRDIPSTFKYTSSTLAGKKDLSEEHPLADYTPPHYIKLLFTDLGILTPAAVSDELIKLYL